MQIQPARSAQWGKGKEDGPGTQEGHLLVDGAMQQKWPCTSTTHVFLPKTLNLIILTSAKCLSLAFVTRTIIKMHNLFSLTNPHTKCQPTAVSLAMVCSSSRLKPGFTQSLVAFLRKLCSKSQTPAYSSPWHRYATGRWMRSAKLRQMLPLTSAADYHTSTAAEGVVWMLFKLFWLNLPKQEVILA